MVSSVFRISQQIKSYKLYLSSCVSQRADVWTLNGIVKKNIPKIVNLTRDLSPIANFYGALSSQCYFLFLFYYMYSGTFHLMCLSWVTAGTNVYSTTRIFFRRLPMRCYAAPCACPLSFSRTANKVKVYLPLFSIFKNLFSSRTVCVCFWLLSSDKEPIITVHWYRKLIISNKYENSFDQST